MKYPFLMYVLLSTLLLSAAASGTSKSSLDGTGEDMANALDYVKEKYREIKKDSASDSRAPGPRRRRSPRRGSDREIDMDIDSPRLKRMLNKKERIRLPCTQFVSYFKKTNLSLFKKMKKAFREEVVAREKEIERRERKEGQNFYDMKALDKTRRRRRGRISTEREDKSSNPKSRYNDYESNSNFN